MQIRKANNFQKNMLQNPYLKGGYSSKNIKKIDYSLEVKKPTTLSTADDALKIQD